MHDRPDDLIVGMSIFVSAHELANESVAVRPEELSGALDRIAKLRRGSGVIERSTVPLLPCWGSMIEGRVNCKLFGSR